MNLRTSSIGRRSLLRFGATGLVSAAIGPALMTCAGVSKTANDAATSDASVGTGRPAPPDDQAPRTAASNVLVVFFSRAGENYFNGGRTNLTIGNTEVAAGMIRDALACDLYKIQPSEPYSDSYDATVQRNVREQNARARPAIADPLASIEAYETIFLGSPVWNVRAPRIMLTFAEQFDFTGKTLYPFVTYAVSGLGNVVDEYTDSFRGATMGEALAIRGEEVNSSRQRIEEWLQRIGSIGGTNAFSSV
jgi:flavodoxin